MKIQEFYSVIKNSRSDINRIPESVNDRIEFELYIYSIRILKEFRNSISVTNKIPEL